MRTRSTVAAAVASLVLALLVGLLAAVAPVGATPAGAAVGAVAVPRAVSGRRTADERQVDRARAPKIDWKRCAPGRSPLARRLECAVIRVPLDYDDPRGATTPLSVERLRAARPGRRIGSLFVNPGGPGGASSQFVTSAARLLGTRTQARFDIVGVDPRGVAGSGRTACRGAIASPPLGFPLSRREVREQIASDDSVRRACARTATPLVAHATTADVARDMDLVRRALGDRQLTYYGISYGSYLGSTYAAMFPHRIRALVIDGVLDPIAWSTGAAGRRVTTPQTTRLRSGFGAYEALTAALTECDRVGRSRCPIAPDALDTWERVLAAARAGRLVVDDSYQPSYQDIVGFALGALYDRRSIPALMRAVGEFAAAIDAADAAAMRSGSGSPARRVDVAASDAYRQLVAARDALRDRGLYAAPAVAARPFSIDVQFPTVLCSDGRNPAAPGRWERAAARADRQSPWFGRLWTWSSSTCAKGGIGSSADAFRGPWPTTTSYPLLIVGNAHDPATPISGARRANTVFRDSVLLTYDAWGHGALGGGTCVTGALSSYLVDRQLPADGTVCKQPRQLFR